MAKRYKYDGQIYCEDDLSEEMDNYGGDLYDLYWELRVAGNAIEWTRYCSTEDSENVYDSYEELIEKEFNHLED